MLKNWLRAIKAMSKTEDVEPHYLVKVGVYNKSHKYKIQTIGC